MLVWSKWSSCSPWNAKATYVIRADPKRFIGGRGAGRGFRGPPDLIF